MRNSGLSRFWASAAAAAMTITAALVLGGATAYAQTMGEYGGTLGQAASFGSSTASSLPAPAAHMNPIGGANSTTTIEISGDDREARDGSNENADRDSRDPRDTYSGDDWSPAR